MLVKAIDKFFPCEKVLVALRLDHAESVKKNQEAHNRLRVACGEGECLQGTFIPKVGVHDDLTIKRQ